MNPKLLAYHLAGLSVDFLFEVADLLPESRSRRYREPACDRQIVQYYYEASITDLPISATKDTKEYQLKVNEQSENAHKLKRQQASTNSRHIIVLTRLRPSLRPYKDNRASPPSLNFAVRASLSVSVQVTISIVITVSSINAGSTIIYSLVEMHSKF